jgi:hypothetical protein
MIKNFKFFHGYVDGDFILYSNGNRSLTVSWDGTTTINAEDELVRVMSEEISRGIDEEIINTITRRINGGSNHGIDYLNHWIRIGDNRA